MSIVMPGLNSTVKRSAKAVVFSMSFLQFFQPGLDTVRAHRVGGHYNFCDVLLHLPEEIVAIGEYPIDGLDRDLLQ